MTSKNQRIKSSFRDPSGFVFKKDNLYYRQINHRYKDNYDALLTSGLYNKLIEENLLLSHQETNLPGITDEAYKVIFPEQIPFISYPYEWSFSMLKHAALTTLKVQKLALEYNLTLKDTSAFNIQFFKGAPVFIDTLSFEKYEKGKPWVPYRQFCQHFLGPLALIAYKDPRLNLLLRTFLDGIPLDLTSRLLPISTKINPNLLTHIHLHAQAQQRLSAKKSLLKKRFKSMDLKSLKGLIDHLEKTILTIKSKIPKTSWSNYYETNSYPKEAFEQKKQLVAQYLDQTKPKTVWDLGANTGVFSRIATSKKALTISMDYDPITIELNYLEGIKTKDQYSLPLVMDLTNPSPAVGWGNQERLSLTQRGPADVVLALALVHHLALSNNLPLPKLGKYFSQICHFLIIEFVPKEDPNATSLLGLKKDIFPDYTQEGFEQSFGQYFHVQSKHPIKNTLRTLYLMEKESK